jgi:lipoprotein-anchoring transpeptidase ErfK/SrfK
MKHRFIILIILLLHITTLRVLSEEDKTNHIYLKLLSKEVCSNRANKCWPVALGRASNKTPNIYGPHYVLRHYKNGFTWQNPFTKQIFTKQKHNLGNIWIGILSTEKGTEIGFHTTPTPNIPLSKQESLGGCVRMKSKDIKEFSSFVNYLDKIYILNE